jgi:hypothetical protein
MPSPRPLARAIAIFTAPAVRIAMSAIKHALWLAAGKLCAPGAVGIG